MITSKIQGLHVTTLLWLAVIFVFSHIYTRLCLASYQLQRLFLFILNRNLSEGNIHFLEEKGLKKMITFPFLNRLNYFY